MFLFFFLFDKNMENKKFNTEYINSNLGHKLSKATIIKISIAQKGELNHF